MGQESFCFLGLKVSASSSFGFGGLGLWRSKILGSEIIENAACIYPGPLLARWNYS